MKSECREPWWFVHGGDPIRARAFWGVAAAAALVASVGDFLVEWPAMALVSMGAFLVNGREFLRFRKIAIDLTQDVEG